MLAWFRQIDDSKTIGEVLSVARDYLATWSPAELKNIPEGCRPGRIRDESDLEELHALLVEEYRLDRLQGEELRALQRLTSFMVRASIRIAELKGRSDPEDDPPAAPDRRGDAARRE